MTVPEEIIRFLDALTATEAGGEWPLGPKADLYRKADDVPIADYIAKVKQLENEPRLAGQTAAQLAQRIRRMHYSTVTEDRRKGASENMDTLIHNNTYTTGFSGTPPLTTNVVDQDVIDFFWSCNTVKTARGHQIDISHVWVIVDLALAGRSVAAPLLEAAFFDTDDLYPVLSWAGDIGNVMNEYFRPQSAFGTPRASQSERIQYMQDAILTKASTADMIGDIDAINLAAIAVASGSGLVLSKMLEDYYNGDALPQAQAKALKKNCSARRFHYFIAHATPAIPANGVTTDPTKVLEVSLKKAEAIGMFKTFFTDMTDDVSSHPFISEATSNIDAYGRDLFEQLCTHFADFLDEGLRTGNIKWPPAQWT